MPPDEFHALYKQMLAFDGENNAVHTQPYPHAREVLADLAARGVKMAVVTNKFEGFARQILGELDLLDPFAAVIGGDTLGKGRAQTAHELIFAAQRLCGSHLTHLARPPLLGDSTSYLQDTRAAGGT